MPFDTNALQPDAREAFPSAPLKNGHSPSHPQDRVQSGLQKNGAQGKTFRRANREVTALSPATRAIHLEIEKLLPNLRKYAIALTRNAVEADDLVQDAVDRALRKLDKWQPGTDLRAWLFTILHNQFISETRRAVTGRDYAGLLAIDLRSNAPTAPPSQEPTSDLRVVERALHQLTKGQRTAILLVGVQGMRYEEAAAVMKVPVGTVRSQAARGREKLREITELFPTRHVERPRTKKIAGAVSPT